MKATKNTLDTLRGRISEVDTEELRQKYRQDDFAKADMVKDLDKRYRWDLFWYCFPDGAWKVFENDGDELNDATMDTALRSIVRPLYNA